MPAFGDASNPTASAESRIAALFHARGWNVEVKPSVGNFCADLVVSKGENRYVVEVKALAEGRPDRVIALLSQAILQARRYADENEMRPLAVVLVRQASPSLRRKVEQFQRDFAPAVAIGLVSETGSSRFIGQGLDGLNMEAPRKSGRGKLVVPRGASDPFSDLNQWMLKVLLAPEVPDKLMNAPRGEYSSISRLAEAAQVSPMSASRFVRRLQEAGFLDDSGGTYRIVRRRDLFLHWQSAAMRSSPELQMSYLIPATGTRHLIKVVSQMDACVGLFAAADLLTLSHVSGVPPYVYVRRLSPTSENAWSGLVPAKAGVAGHLVLKQASFPESLFRAAVRVDGALVSDVLQIWLDAAAHPSRGAEQADFLRHNVLADVVGSEE